MASVTSTAADHSSYIMDSQNGITSMREGGRFNRSVILTFADESEWVFLSDKGKERFCGFLYLKKALERAGVDKIFAAENKMAIHDGRVIYLSEYQGETKIDDPNMKWTEDLGEQLRKLNDEVGFIDTVAGTNLRLKNDSIYVFDTEKTSFSPAVRPEIDQFLPEHDAIRASLEGQLKTS